jgi:outer membrane protein assembly factor BamA
MPFLPSAADILPLLRACALSLLILLSAALPSRAQDAAEQPDPDAPLGIADSVIVFGNTKTKTYVILNEMTLKCGSLVTRSAIEFDRNRIYSLGLFTYVDILFDTLSAPRVLLVNVGERWHILPLLMFGFRDGDPKKLYLGGGVLHNNFQGKNQKVMGVVTLGYDPSVTVSYQDPLLNRNEQLYFASSLSYSRIRNRSILEAEKDGDFRENHYDAEATVGKRFTLYQWAGITLGASFVRVSAYAPGRTVTPSGRDAFPRAAVQYVLDSRDLGEYAMRGSYVGAFALYNGFGISRISFGRFTVDLRTYIPLSSRLSLVGRGCATLSAGGQVPSYAHVYFGYNDRIRGYYKTVFEGENLLGGTAELRFTLLQPRVLRVGVIALPPEFSYLRFGISLALFTDTGLAWFRSGRPALQDFASGYGGSVDFLLPYSFVVRLGEGISDLGQKQFFLDIRRPI